MESLGMFGAFLLFVYAVISVLAPIFLMGIFKRVGDIRDDLSHIRRELGRSRKPSPIELTEERVASEPVKPHKGDPGYRFSDRERAALRRVGLNPDRL